MKLRGRAAATRAFVAFHRGDVPGIIRYSRQALEYLPVQQVIEICQQQMQLTSKMGRITVGTRQFPVLV
jgi:hypothetical protein